MLNTFDKPKTKMQKNEMIDVRKIMEMNQLKSKAKQLFNEFELFESNQQSKIEFFYRPYKWMDQVSHMIPMQFDEDIKDIMLRTPQQSLPARKWRKLYNLILKWDINYWRKTFKIANPQLYSEVKNIAHEVIDKEFSFQATSDITLKPISLPLCQISTPTSLSVKNNDTESNHSIIKHFVKKYNHTFHDDNKSWDEVRHKNISEGNNKLAPIWEHKDFNPSFSENKKLPPHIITELINVMREKKQAKMNSDKYDKFWLTPENSTSKIPCIQELKDIKPIRYHSKIKKQTNGYIYIKKDRKKKSSIPKGNFKITYAHHGRHAKSNNFSNRSIDSTANSSTILNSSP